jgi:hypothetical protein
MYIGNIYMIHTVVLLQCFGGYILCKAGGWCVPSSYIEDVFLLLFVRSVLCLFSFPKQYVGNFRFILGSWFRASYSKYVYEYPTRCSDIFVLFQYLYMFRLPAVPIIRSTILQLIVTGITYCNIKVLHKKCVEWDILYKIPPSTHFLYKNFVWQYVIPVTVNCSIVLVMMGTVGTRNM